MVRDLVEAVVRLVGHEDAVLATAASTSMLSMPMPEREITFTPPSAAASITARSSFA